jgi:hypothetical protein
LHALPLAVVGDGGHFFTFSPFSEILSRNARLRTASSVLFSRSAIATELSPDAAIFLRRSSSVIVQGWRIPLIIFPSSSALQNAHLAQLHLDRLNAFCAEGVGGSLFRADQR